MSVPPSPRMMLDHSDFGLNESLVSKPVSSTTGGPGDVVSFMAELDKLQDQQMLYTKKIEREKQRKDSLDEQLMIARKNLRDLRDKTRNGTIVRDGEIANRKQIDRFEQHLQMSRVKLSIAKTDNIAMKKKYGDLRRDKVIAANILHGLEKELTAARLKLAGAQKEITIANDKKYRVKILTANIKHKMMRDMEDFSRELSNAKQNISSTRESILGTIRDRIKATATSMGATQSFMHKFRTQEAPRIIVDNGINSEIATVLRETGFETLAELWTAVQASEEIMFAKYNEIQEKNTETELLENDNKHLEQRLEQQISDLEKLEGHNDKVRLELEQHITNIQKAIAKFDVDYATNVDVLNSISEGLMNILKNVAIDEEALDQQLLSTGITDRNIDDFLGLIEQRIDDMIQLSKAAVHQPIRKGDFVRVILTDKVGQLQVLNLPSLHEAAASHEEEDDTDDAAAHVPVNIQQLKDFMMQKMRKATKKDCRATAAVLGSTASLGAAAPRPPRESSAGGGGAGGAAGSGSSHSHHKSGAEHHAHRTHSVSGAVGHEAHVAEHAGAVHSHSSSRVVQHHSQHNIGSANSTHGHGSNNASECHLNDDNHSSRTGSPVNHQQ